MSKVSALSINSPGTVRAEAVYSSPASGQFPCALRRLFLEPFKLARRRLAARELRVSIDLRQRRVRLPSQKSSILSPVSIDRVQSFISIFFHFSLFLTLGIQLRVKPHRGIRQSVFPINGNIAHGTLFRNSAGLATSTRREFRADLHDASPAGHIAASAHPSWSNRESQRAKSSLSVHRTWG